MERKSKIINDPVYGFVSIPGGDVLELIEHRYFQRLRRISQLGLTHLVYPGALHTRFHHAIGALHLMQLALDSLIRKGISINEGEYRSACMAILLHDIGHGPYSHALEHSLIPVSHEIISHEFMRRISNEKPGKIELAMKMFRNEYPRPFFHQLISSQLDTDRMDYLRRDSFYTGVSEGMIGFDRIIQMLDVVDDQLVVEEKGIYSVEKFIIARRLMYWQVYLHKTVIAAESLLTALLSRARKVMQEKMESLFTTPALGFFLERNISSEDFFNDDAVLEAFARLDDFDILSSIKGWTEAKDPILAHLSNALLERKIPKIEISRELPEQSRVNTMKEQVAKRLGISIEDTSFLVYTGKVSNSAYQPSAHHIQIRMKDGKLMNLTEASDQNNLEGLSTEVVRHYLCYPR